LFRGISLPFCTASSSGLAGRYDRLGIRRKADVCLFSWVCSRGTRATWSRPTPHKRADSSSGKTLRGSNFQRGRQHVRLALRMLATQSPRYGSRRGSSRARFRCRMLPDLQVGIGLDLCDVRGVPRIWIGNAVTVPDAYDLSSIPLRACCSGRRRLLCFPPAAATQLYPGPIHITAGVPIRHGTAAESRFGAYRGSGCACRRAGRRARARRCASSFLRLCIMYSRWHVNVWSITGGRTTTYHLAATLAPAWVCSRFEILPAAERAIWPNLFDSYVFKATAILLHIWPPACTEPHGPTQPELVREDQGASCLTSSAALTEISARKPLASAMGLAPSVALESALVGSIRTFYILCICPVTIAAIELCSRASSTSLVP